MTEVRTWVSQYTVNATAGQDPINDDNFDVTVDQAPQQDGTVLWAVRLRGQCLSRTGRWSYEPLPSSRTDRWLTSHRHDLETAMRLATKAAPLVTINGWTVDGTLLVTGTGTPTSPTTGVRLSGRC